MLSGGLLCSVCAQMKVCLSSYHNSLRTSKTMQIRSKVGTSVKTVQGFLQLYWFNAPRAPALVHSCTRGFCRCSVLIACRNTVGLEPKSHPQWQLQQLPGHLQVALDLPTRLSCCSSLQIAENFPAQPCAHITFPGLLLPASSFPNQPISACGLWQVPVLPRCPS